MKIDKIYVISLDAGVVSAQDRIVNKLRDFKFKNQTPYEIMQAYDARTGDFPDGVSTYQSWNLGKDNWNEWWQRDVLPGEVGCGISHSMIWKKMIEEGVERALILEDDFKTNNSIDDLPEPQNPFDLIWLGRGVINKDESSMGDCWVKPKNSYRTHSYLLTLEGAKKLANTNYFNNIIPVDEFLSACTYSHRRPDIVKLFPPILNALAHKDEHFTWQDRSKAESTIESIQKPDYGNFEVLDDSDWEAWKEKYLNLTTLKGEWDLMVDDLGHNIYEFPLFTERFCREIVAMAEAKDKWTIDRHANYPTNDVLLNEIGLNNIYDRVLHEVVRPLCIHLWKLEGPSWDAFSNENFMARYTMSRQSHLALHHDRSHLTLVVKLNDEFDGGGTWFPKYNLLSNPERIGTATIHPGMITHQHGARPIYAGRRYIAVSFIRTHDEP